MGSQKIILNGNTEIKKHRKVPCCARLTKNFLSDSSIHGVKYLSDETRHWTEKTFWSIIFIITISATAYLFFDSFKQWYDSPILVSSSEKFMNIWHIPFPAVTICPIVAFRNNSIPFPVAMKILELKWQRVGQNADDFFTPINTNQGRCFTFNMVNLNDLFRAKNMNEVSTFVSMKENKIRPNATWQLEDGYTNKEVDAYPRRGFGSGDEVGLSFKLSQNTSDTFNGGYKIAVHLPSELPRLDRHSVRIPSDKFVTLSIHPVMVVSENLNFYTPETRQCFFQDKKHLYLFRNYTRPNCQIECLIFATNEACNCTPPYFPQTKDFKTCDMNNESVNERVAISRKNLTMENMKKSLKTSHDYGDVGSLACGCLAPCTSLSYNVELSYSDTAGVNQSTAEVSISFQDDDFMFLKRTQVYTFTQFLANFGGILGLFLGVSVLSFIEIIYFLMFRQYE